MNSSETATNILSILRFSIETSVYYCLFPTLIVSLCIVAIIWRRRKTLKFRSAFRYFIAIALVQFVVSFLIMVLIVVLFYIPFMINLAHEVN